MDIKKIILFIITLPLLILATAYDIVKLILFPFVFVIILFVVLIEYLKDDFDFAAFKKVILVWLIMGIEVYFMAIWDKDII